MDKNSKKDPVLAQTLTKTVKTVQTVGQAKGFLVVKHGKHGKTPKSSGFRVSEK